MFADPLTLTGDWTTITADASENVVFVATERAADHSLYRFHDESADGRAVEWKLFLGHQYGRRNRFTARLTVDSVIPDILNSSLSSQFSQSVYVVADVPPTGPYDPYFDGSPTLVNIKNMMHVIGGLLISVDTADPAFFRVINGET